MQSLLVSHDFSSSNPDKATSLGAEDLYCPSSAASGTNPQFSQKKLNLACWELLAATCEPSTLSGTSLAS